MNIDVSDESISELRVLTEEQISALTGLSRATFKALRRKGEGPRVTVLSSGRLGYQVRHFREWMDSQAEDRDDASSNRDQRADSELRVLSAVKAHLVDKDPEAVVRALRGSSQQVAQRLAASVDLLAYVLELGGDAQGALAGLVDAVQNETKLSRGTD